MIPQTELDEIRKRADAATAGPWSYRCGPSTCLNNDAVMGPTDKDVVFCNSGRGSGDPEPPDLDFILNARSDIPRLLDDREELRKLLVENCACLVYGDGVDCPVCGPYRQ